MRVLQVWREVDLLDHVCTETHARATLAVRAAQRTRLRRATSDVAFACRCVGYADGSPEMAMRPPGFNTRNISRSTCP